MLLFLQILLAFVVYSMLESVNWYAIIPIAVYHGSFMAMIIFTCQVSILVIFMFSAFSCYSAHF